MSVSVIWLDSEQAKLFSLSEDRMEREIIRFNHQVVVHFFNEIVGHLKAARNILILGPGVSKDHFLAHLKNFHAPMAQQVVGCERSDHPTDHQIAAYAMKYFHKPVA